MASNKPAGKTSVTPTAVLWHPRFWPTWIAVGLVSVFYQLPHTLRDSIAALLARLFFRPYTKQIVTARINLKLCFPQWSDTRVEEFLQEYFVRYIQVLAQSPALWWSSGERLWNRLDVRGLAYLGNLQAERKPIILLFNHALALDFAAVGLATRFPLHGIYKPFDNVVIEWLFRRSRERFGSALVTRGQSMRSTMRALSAGELLVYLCDEDFGAQKSVFAPFFNQPKATLTMLPKLARVSGAKVVPVYSYYDTTTSKIVVEILPQLNDYPCDDEQQNALYLNQVLERMIEICPEQYLWKLRLFRTRPDGVSSHYT